MQQYVMGLDNGNTVIKAAVFTLSGQQVAVAQRQTPVDIPRPGFNQRDMDEVYDKNCECVREALEKAGIPGSAVAGLAICGHGKGLYPWGKNGKPAYHGIASTDNRAWRYPEKWRQDGTFDRWYQNLCQQVIPCQQLPLLAWMKDKEPEVYQNIRYAFSAKDYVRFRLTGEAFSEATDISGSALMDVRNAAFSREMLEDFGVGEVYDMLAPLRYSAEKCGAITEEAAAKTGLLQGTPVAGGMFDIDACAIAMDVTDEEALCTITGTWSINEFIAKAPVTGTAIAMNSLYALPGYYLIEECSPTSAGNLEWFLQNLMEYDPLPPGERLYTYSDNLVASISPAESDVYFLPFLYGSNAHPLAKGSFVGLTSFHTKPHMLRALYEGVVYSHKVHIDKLLSARTPPKTLRMAGGAVNSALWVQMFADILQLPIETVVGVSELGALGCAMAAAVAAGIYKDYPEAAKQMVKINPPVLPDPEKGKIYAEKYEKYKAVQDALDTVWHRFEV